MAGAAIGAGTLVIGFQDVIATLQEFWKAGDATVGKTAQLAAQQLATANSLISADEAVANARQAAQDAERNAAQAIITSRRAVADAVVAQARAVQDATRNNQQALQQNQRAVESLQVAEENEVKAAKALAQAKEDAARAIEDATNQEKDAELAHKQAVLDLRHAQDALTAYSLTSQGALAMLAKAQADVLDPTKDHEQALRDLTTAQDVYNKASSNTTGPPTQDIQQLALAVQQAQQRVSETETAWERAGEDATKATTAGVNGSKQVTSAQDQLIAAQRSVRDATLAVADARAKATQTAIDGNRAIQDSDQRLADARTALQQAEITGDQQVQKSKQAVNDAIRAQAQALAASQASAEAAAGSLATYNAMLAKLAPTAQDAVMAVTGLKDKWEALQRSVQQNLFAGIGNEVRNLGAVVLPVLQVGLDKTATALNVVIKAFTSWLSSKDTVRDMGILFDNVASATQKMAPGIKSVLQIVMDLITVGSDFLPDLADGFSQGADKVADFVRNARDTGKLKEWIQSGIDAVKDLYNIFKDVVGILDDLGGKRGFNPQLLDDVSKLIHDIRVVADGIGWVIGKIEDFSDVTMQTRGVVFGFFGNLGNVIWDSIKWVWKKMQDFWDFITTPPKPPDFGKFFQGLWNSFKSVVNSVADAWNSLHFSMPSFDLFGWHTPSFTVTVPQLPHWYASGGPASGLAIVGERGPELVRLPTGSHVMPATNTRTELGKAQGEQKITIEMNLSGLPGGILDMIASSVRGRGGDPSLLGIKV